MKILLAPDKFKGSLAARAVCQAIQLGLTQHYPKAEFITHPMADGGDGSLAILTDHLALSRQEVETVDPLGRPLQGHYYTSAEAAFIELATASGLVLLNTEERSPLRTSTLGTGQLMVDAIAKGYRQLYLFLGGSATNDAGMGIATALGYTFLDEQHQVVAPTGQNLSRVRHLRQTKLAGIDEVSMTLLCDVNNPLFGLTGASHVYAAQKGATPSAIEQLDVGLRHFAAVLQQHSGVAVGQLPGGGAAGGVGAGLVALFGAQLQKGFDAISKLTQLEQQIKQADLVISGEGRLDEQSLQGKVIDGVAQLCRKHRKPLVLFVGKNDLPSTATADLGVQAVYSISERAKNLADAMDNGSDYLTQAAAELTG